ncbi:MBL fold metallo-hydrolase [Roseobacter sp. YSTF-M11]|uniref:MBL fold metallo-hydrolase n=1 Tax=Roseobacter insulae TaxID=2859783 RepID=A0A9X1FRK7_9RHOB|nr:MBL fold metallo-hydrolase [Roseobacter insulae]MBW4706352.1 MBL fold metallo-hydrolase [Roseobacter insulae]
MTVTTLYDGEIRREVTEDYIRNASLEDLQTSLEEAFLPTTHFNNPYTFTAVEIDGRHILIDAGTGDLLAPSIDDGARAMAAAGLDPNAVELVVLTHFHPDHVGGIADADGRPTFPNAVVLFPEVEYAFIHNDQAVSALPATMQDFAAAARAKLSAYGDALRLFADGEILAPGIRASASPGHTPGHMSVVLESEGEILIVVGDAITYPALFVPNPGWHVVFDADGPRAEATRRDLLRRAQTSCARVIGTHFPFPSIGRIFVRNGRFAYVPEQWTNALGG